MFSLNLKEKERDSPKQENELYGGEKVNLKFLLPNGQKMAHEFLMGQDVEWVKHYLSEKMECNRTDIKLFFNDKHMIEILALCDISGLKDNSLVEVRYNPGCQPKKS